jgi:hypothetical protein
MLIKERILAYLFPAESSENATANEFQEHFQIIKTFKS